MVQVVSFNSAFLGTLGGDQNMVFNQDLKVWHENKDYSYQDQSEKSIDYDLESNNNDFEFDQAEKDLNEIDQNMLDSLDYASCKEFTLPNDSQSFIRIPTNVTDVVTPRKSDLVTPVKDSSFGILQRDTMGLFNLKGSTPMSATKYASLQEDVSMSAIKNNSQQDSIGLFNLKGSTPVSAIKNNSQHDSIGLFDLKGNTPVSAIKNISQHDLNSLDTPVHSNDHHVSTFEDTFDQVDEKHLIETRAFLNTNETNNTPYHEPNKTFQDLDQKFQSLANIVIEEDSILVKAPTESIFKQSKQKEPIESIFTQSKQKQSNQNFQSRELFKSDLKSNTMDTYRSTASESNQDTILVHLVKALNLTTTWKSLTSLNLSNQNLNNIVGLDSTIPHLETLDISNNRIKFLKGIPRSVKYLNAKQNCIDDSTSFSGCDGLLELNCSYNLLKSTNSVSILNRLRVLDLSFNYLESLDLPSNIVDLNVSHNRIKILDGLNGNFKVLNVSFNLIENVDVSALVEDFDLAGNLLTRLDLKHLRNLKRLDVSRNSISELNVDANIVIADFNPLLNFNASCNLERFSCQGQSSIT